MRKQQRERHVRRVENVLDALRRIMQDPMVPVIYQGEAASIFNDLTRLQEHIGTIPTKKTVPPLQHRETTWLGVTYPSRGAAAAALGITPETLSRWIKRGLTDRTKYQTQEVKIDGITYKSKADAERVLGIPKGKLSK